MRLEEWKKGLTCTLVPRIQSGTHLPGGAHQARLRLWCRPTKTEAAVNHCRLKLERLTVGVCELVCKRARLERVWEQDFVEQLLEHPDQPGACWARIGRVETV